MQDILLANSSTTSRMKMGKQRRMSNRACRAGIFQAWVEIQSETLHLSVECP